jgi:hypothetical protein
MVTPITVTSHVARDFLQNAAYFNSIPKVVWEYVSNSLDNPIEGVPVTVLADIGRNRIRVTDNACGMSREDLHRFFQMHGENIARLKGRHVRGRFGTGKCAAFGIANTLRVSSVKDGRRNVVELRRGDIENARTGEPFPVRDVVVDQRVDGESGTVVDVEDLNVKQLDIDGTIAYVERHLSRHQQQHTVFINNHPCEYVEPLAVESREFDAPSDVAGVLGNVKLVVKVSPTPLDPDTNGIDVVSNGLWHETTLAGLENREMIRYLFGEVDVPALETDQSPIPPFDNTRSNRLNPQNHLVAVLLGWISDCLETVREEIAERERERRRSEEARKLDRDARELVRILNEDFASFHHQLARARRLGDSDLGPGIGEITQDESGVVVPTEGGIEQTPWQTAGQPFGDGTRGITPPGPGDQPREGPDLIAGNSPGEPHSPSEKGQRKMVRGGFNIEYRHETSEAPRSRYERDARTIVVNLDHPQLATAATGGGGTEGREFRQLCHEIAFVEYAIALPYEMAQLQFEYYDVEDALFEIRETINRIAKRAAALL